MAKFFRKDALMTTAVAPFPSVSPRVQLTARQRACLEQIVRRQTRSQRLVRRAKILLALPRHAPDASQSRDGPGVVQAVVRPRVQAGADGNRREQ